MGADFFKWQVSLKFVYPIDLITFVYAWMKFDNTIYSKL